MPIREEVWQKDANELQPKNEEEKKAKKKKKDEESKQSGLQHQINELLTTFLRNIEIDVNGICVRVMTKEQTEGT